MCFNEIIMWKNMTYVQKNLLALSFIFTAGQMPSEKEVLKNTFNKAWKKFKDKK